MGDGRVVHGGPGARGPRTLADAGRLLDLGRLLSADLDVDSVLQALLAAACEFTGARYAAVAVLAAERGRLERFVTRGVDERARHGIGAPPSGRGVLGLVIDRPEPLRVADVGAHPRSYGFPAGHPPMRSFLGVPMRVDGEPWGVLYLGDEALGTFDEADEQAMLVLADWAATAIANARRFAAECKRRNELEHAVRGLEATAEIARAVGGETRLDAVLELIVKRGRALVEARGMAVLLADGGGMRVAAIAGELDAGLVGTGIAGAASAVGAVRSGRSEVGAGATLRPRFAMADLIEATAAIRVPLVHQGLEVGMLEAFDRLHDGPGFSADDEWALEAFAESAAIAVATAQDVAAQTRWCSIEAADRERAHWARELHDEALQELGALKLTLRSAERCGDPAVVREAVREAIGHSEHAIRALREVISDLRPATLDALGTQAALEALVERLRARSSLEIELRVDLAYEAGRARTRHAPALEAAIYRTVQEALTNVVKHAAAARVSVFVREDDDGVELGVEDDGCGFAAEARPESGFGLIGIGERVGLLDGALCITTSPGSGTSIRVRLPSRRRPECAPPG